MRRSPSSALLVLLAACPGTRAAGAPPCPTDRTVQLADQAAIDRFAGCTTASGVTVRTGATIDLGRLRSLETITGDLVIGPTLGLEEVALLELREVGGTIQVASNASLRGLLLPRLERAGRIQIESNSALVTIAMPRLATVGGSLVITGDGSLEVLELSGLVTVGKDLVITDNPRLGLILGGKLARVLEVRIERNLALDPAQIEGLRAKTPPE